MGNFETALKFTSRWEGGFVDHPADPGGATNQGITQRTYDAWRAAQGLPPRPVRDIVAAEVEDIYRDRYWTPSGAGKLELPLAVVVFDTAVQFGVGGLAEFLAETPDGPGRAQRLVEARIAYRHQRVREAPSQAVFLQGWLNRDQDLRRYISTLGGSTMDERPAGTWLLIVPRDNWRNPIEYHGSFNPVLKQLADRLELVRTVDDVGRKFYLDLPKPAPAEPVWQNADQLTKHFHLAEFRCHDAAGTMPPDRAAMQKVAELLERVRAHHLVDAPLRITSGYRTPAHNASIGGEPNSYHTRCQAADIWCPELCARYGDAEMVRRLARAARESQAGGVGVYPNFVHVDTGPRREWTG